MVEDPLLAQHLSHWGINMMSMEKTEKSMVRPYRWTLSNPR
jgi:ubiquitin carboxyl-terminal hydrolase 5/13